MTTPPAGEGLRRSSTPPAFGPPDAAEVARVTALLGRPPRGRFVVVVRDPAGEPAVLRNAPLLEDGTPMPTRYWLVDPQLRRRIDRLESSGGVRAAEAAVDAGELAAAHARYAVERDEDLPADWAGPRPSGGVGGTRRGVKCLHAHYAWHLAGGDDPVGRWVADALGGAAGAPDAPGAEGAPRAVGSPGAVGAPGAAGVAGSPGERTNVAQGVPPAPTVER